jgi:hypothetical protein
MVFVLLVKVSRLLIEGQARYLLIGKLLVEPNLGKFFNILASRLSAGCLEEKKPQNRQIPQIVN